MTGKQSTVVCGTILLAVSANLVGMFAIELHFENRRFTAADDGRAASTEDTIEILVPEPTTLARPSRIAPRPLTDERSIRLLIDAELPDAKLQEREIWQDQIRSMQPGEAYNLLDIRRRLGSDVPELDDWPSLSTGDSSQPDRRGLTLPSNAPLTAPVPSDVDSD